MSFWCLQFFQKTNENNLTWGTIVIKLNFLGKLKIPKRHIQIKWPLTWCFLKRSQNWKKNTCLSNTNDAKKPWVAFSETINFMYVICFHDKALKRTSRKLHNHCNLWHNKRRNDKMHNNQGVTLELTFSGLPLN